MDLNLIGESENINTLIKRAYDLGYECVAINTVITSSDLSAKKVSIPEPRLVSFEGKFGRKFRILNRLTAVIEDALHTHLLTKSPVAKKYDLLAVQPVGEKMLQHVTSAVDVDLVCLNLSEDLGFTLKKTHVGPAFQKGVCFEISYAPCLHSQSSMRSVISNAQLLVEVCRGKNIVLSSGAAKPLELRSPDDVSNLALLFGLKRNQAVEAVRKTGHTVLSHSRTRTETGCGFVSISGCIKIPKQQGWIVKVCKVPKIEEVKGPLAKKRTHDMRDETECVSKKIKVDNK